MIVITDEQLKTPGSRAFASAFLTLQAELEVSVYSGTGTVVVSWGDALAAFAGPPPDAETLDPIEIAGLFEGVITDLHLSRLYANWTTDFGGALRLRAVFEEEGTELRGTIDVDFDHMQLDVFMVPSLDPTDTVVWELQLGFDIDGGAITDAARSEIEKRLLDGEVVGLLIESLQGFTDQLNGLLGLASLSTPDIPAVPVPIRSIDIDAGEARFDPVPAGDRRIDVVFDAVEVHDDGDGIGGQGELSFRPTVGEVDGIFSEPVSAASGTVVPLEGSQWRTSVSLPEGVSLSVKFEAVERNGDNAESLGTINVDLDPADAPVALALTSPTQDYTLMMRMVPRTEVERPPRTRHLLVSVPTVELFKNPDTTGKGEVHFWALADGQPTVVSETKVERDDNPVVDLAGMQVELYHPELEDLVVRVVGWDDDPSRREWLGEARLELPAAAIGVGAGPEQVRADSDDFMASIMIVDLDAPDDPPGAGTVRRLVAFESVSIERDGEPFGGDILASATVNGVIALGGGTPIDASAATTLPLGGPSWTAEVSVPLDGALELQAQVIDVVGRVDDATQDNDVLLGTVTRTFDAADDFGLGEHVLADSDGDFAFHVRVIDPATIETVSRLVVFDSVTVEHDGEVFAGEILASATANGQALGGGEPVDASAGTDLPLVGEQWRTEVTVRVDKTLELEAQVIDVDGKVDDATQDNDDLLGTVTRTFDASDDFGLGEHVLADSDGDFAFHMRILDPAQEGDFTATVRFEEVEILHDHTTIGRGAFWADASVNGFPVGTSDRFEAGRGDSIVLDPAADWTHNLAIAEGEEIALVFEVFEADDNDHVSLGTASARLTPPPWPDGLQSVTSDEGDFILRYRVFDGAQRGANSMLVTFLEITTLNDGDGLSEGELRYLATANEQTSGLSVLQKARSDEPQLLVGDLWTLEPRLDPEDELTVTFTVYDEDSDALELHDRSEQRYTLAQSWGLGEHVVMSSDERFRLRYAIEPADAEAVPDLPDAVPLLVEFTAVEVHDDGDRIDRGEVSFAGKVNGVTVLQSPEYKVRSGDEVLLGEPLAPRTIWVTAGEDLEVELTATERDTGADDVLGTSTRTHRAADGWDLGEHEVPAPGGAITAKWRVDRADGPRVRVKFLHVHVYEDKDPVGRGKLVCQGAVDGASTGPSLPMRVGSDGHSSADDRKSDMYIGGPRWRKEVSYDPDDPRVLVTFTVTELDALSGDDLLGTVDLTLEFDASDAADPDVGRYQLHESVMADSERYELTFIAHWMNGQPGQR
jgi:hypothetical protein